MIKKLLVSAFFGVLVLLPSGTIVAASATEDISTVCASNPSSSLCTGYDKGQASDNPIVDTLTIVINILSFVAGILAVFLVMYGGFKYIVSAGDAGKVTSAKNTILYALVGIVISVVLFIIQTIIVIAMVAAIASVVQKCNDLGPGTHVVGGTTYECGN